MQVRLKEVDVVRSETHHQTNFTKMYYVSCTRLYTRRTKTHVTRHANFAQKFAGRKINFINCARKSSIYLLGAK